MITFTILLNCILNDIKDYCDYVLQQVQTLSLL